jgi:two-component system chemotaxis response regulator CheB
MGGTVIAQDEASSECFGMPGSAIKTGVVDFILPLMAIAPMLLKLA